IGFTVVPAGHADVVHGPGIRGVDALPVLHGSQPRARQADHPRPSQRIPGVFGVRRPGYARADSRPSGGVHLCLLTASSRRGRTIAGARAPGLLPRARGAAADRSGPVRPGAGAHRAARPVARCSGRAALARRRRAPVARQLWRYRRHDGRVRRRLASAAGLVRVGRRVTHHRVRQERGHAVPRPLVNVPPPPAETYRLQFHAGFTFDHARRLVPYLYELGVSHVYASPYLRARSGSTHGYDVADPSSLNPELGSAQDYDQMVAELQRFGMGQLVDVVPNHMGIGDPGNYRWLDVLENGPASIYARFFDINWRSSGGQLHKLVVPTLGDQYGNVLENGELRVEYADGA